MAEKKLRIPIPEDVAAEVLFRSDRTCCVCHKYGKTVQIHHINDNPADNSPANMAVLCLECHAQTQISGGFGRKLNSRIVILYRDHWLNVVTMRRAAETLISELAKEQTVVPLTADDTNVWRVEVGASFRHLGIVLTLIDASCSFNVRLNNSNYRTGSGYETYDNVEAGHGAKFIIVKFRVLNDAKRDIDLTCGYPIKNYLIDEREREFTTIESLHRFQGNPECNYRLQPGFESDMTYIYRVPVDADIRAFAFEDATDLGRDRTVKATKIPLTVPASGAV